MANGCKREWKRIKETLYSESLIRKFKQKMRIILDKAPKGSDSILSFRQRHYIGRIKPVNDAVTVINIDMLLGEGMAKGNIIWWDLLKDVAKTKSKYNYQLEIGYEMKYDKVENLKNSKAPNVILKCFRNLKPLYQFLTKE